MTYRKIETSIWNDGKFHALSLDGKLTYFFLITHPNMTALGAMRAGISGLAEELVMEDGRFRQAFSELLAQDMAEHDVKAACLFIPNFVQYQAAESPNVIRAWAKTLPMIPDCPLKEKAVGMAQSYAEGLSEAFSKAFREAFREAITKDMGKDIPNPVSSKQEAVSPFPSQGENVYYGGTQGGDDFGADFGNGGAV